jgi:hypothetical protein
MNLDDQVRDNQSGPVVRGTREKQSEKTTDPSRARGGERRRRRTLVASQIPRRFSDPSIIRAHVPGTRETGAVRIPLQSVLGKRLHATPSHQLSPKRIRSSLGARLLGYPRLDVLLIQVDPIHLNPTAHPWVRDNLALVLLDVAPPDDGVLKVGLLVDQWGAIFTLQVAGGCECQ